MKAATVQELKQELTQLKPSRLVDICLRLSKFKKENKELLTYLIFESGNEKSFVDGIKAEVEQGFAEMNSTSLYYAKKTLRKLVRTINKYCRYSNRDETEIELRLHFCEQLLESGIPFGQNPVILNLYNGQVRKVNMLLHTLHEDLQYEYRERVAALHEDY